MYDIPILKNLKNIDVFILLKLSSTIVLFYKISEVVSMGKHSFIIYIDINKFIPQSLIKILIVDSNNTPLYIEIPLFLEGGLKRVSFIVNELNTNGLCNIVLTGILDTVDIPQNYRLRYNYRFIKNINISKLSQNLSDIRFYKTPNVLVSLFNSPIVNFSTSYSGIIWNSILNTSSNINIDINLYNTLKTLSGSKLVVSLLDIISSSNNIVKLCNNRICSAYSSSNLIQLLRIKLVLNNKLFIYETSDFYKELKELFTDNNSYVISYYQKIPLTNLSVLTDDKGNIYYRSYLNINVNNLNSYSGRLYKIKTFYKLLLLSSNNYKILSEVQVTPKNLLTKIVLSDILLNIGIIQSSSANRWYSYISASAGVTDNTSTLRDKIVSLGKLENYSQYEYLNY